MGFFISVGYFVSRDLQVVKSGELKVEYSEDRWPMSDDRWLPYYPTCLLVGRYLLPNQPFNPFPY